MKKLIILLLVINCGCSITARNKNLKVENVQESIIEQKNTLGGETPQDEKELHGSYPVVYVIDGDTFIVDIDGVETKVRLIGVDTPESVNRNEEKNTEEGTIAANYTKELLQGKNVWIEYDQEYRDKYERILAYVYLDSDGRVMLQDMLLENGFANCMRIEPNTKYANHFAELQEKARTESAGFWEYDFWY